MNLCALLLALLAAGGAGDTLSVEEARRLVARSLGEAALPGRGWALRVEADGPDAARLVAERIHRGTVYRFGRGESGWRLDGVDFPDPMVSGPGTAGGGEATPAGTVVIEGAGLGEQELAARILAARRDGAGTVVLHLDADGAEGEDAHAPAPPSPEMPTAETEGPAATGVAAERTRHDLRVLAGALGRRERGEGRYPAAPESTTVEAMERAGGFLSPFYLRNVPRHDGWGRPFVYRAGRSGRRYELRSAGPDGALETDDDIVVVNGRIEEP